MGTNYYLRKVKPRLVYDEYHIAKRSAGWRVSFQDSEDYRDEEGAPAYHSVADIRNLLKSGEYELADEYGRTFGTDSLGEFDELCKWRGGSAYDGKPLGSYPDDQPPWDHELGGTGYRDPEGYAFDSQYFR